jgi:hypothetical protein
MVAFHRCRQLLRLLGGSELILEVAGLPARAGIAHVVLVVLAGRLCRSRQESPPERRVRHQTDAELE